MRRSRGVTLIELMVVMSIIAVLMGIGLAMLSESNKDMGLRSTRSSILGICRYAKAAARNSRAPASVRIDADGRFVTTVVRRPMGAWHFEDTAGVGTIGRPVSLTAAKIVDDGRIGRGVLFQDSGGFVDCGNVAMLSKDQGLFVEVWHRPKAHRKNRILIEKSGEFGIGISRDGHLQAYVGVEASRVAIDLAKPEEAPLPEGRWTKIALLWDGAALTLLVNDHPLARKTGKAEFGMGDAPVMIGTREYPLDGNVDEARVDALIEESRMRVADELKVAGPAEIRWDENGALDRALHSGPVTIRISSPVDSATVTVNLLGGSQ